MSIVLHRILNRTSSNESSSLETVVEFRSRQRVPFKKTRQGDLISFSYLLTSDPEEINLVETLIFLSGYQESNPILDTLASLLIKSFDAGIIEAEAIIRSEQLHENNLT